jgi:dTDP-4-dehydrorhamnose reductase
MRTLVFSANGMLGHELCRMLADRMEIRGTLRDDPGKSE